MADEEDKDSKTEDASEKKIKDALDKGQTAVSREIPLLVSLICFTTYFIFSAKELMFNTSVFLGSVFEQVGEITLHNAQDTEHFFGLVGGNTIVLMAPLCLILMLGGVLSSVLQNEPRLVLERIKPKISKLSLIKGWSRVFGKQGLVEFLKSLAKLTFTGSVVFGSLYSSPEEFLSGMFQSPQVFGDAIMEIIAKLMISVCLAMTFIGVADLLWSRFSWKENLKMTKKEISDEYKQAEGDPILKARMRSLARDRSRKRMMDAVPSATLIIANPTHISIALRFDNDIDDAPVVVAKGQDLIALKIREIASESNVPIFVKVELARALNKAVQVDQIIPIEFYSAVAELINLVYRRSNQIEANK